MKARILGTSAVLALAMAMPSLAQAPNLPFASIGSGGRKEAPTPKVAPPPALPGASTNGSDAVPASRSSLDMEPTDALFDAINRGDIGAARDAISRGADLHGRNVLGMSPLELSVDLGRNDISFMLLSMQAGDHGRVTSSAAATKPAPAKPAKQTAARRVIPSAKTAAASKEPPPTQTARLFSGDGGTPIPNAGFLGFDPTRR